MSRVLGQVFALACLAGIGSIAATPASAALYGFTITGFTDGASLTVQFDGADTNGDGVIYGYYPADCGCVPDPTEVTTLSLTFTGNSVIPAFSASSTNFASPEQTLTFEPEFGDGFELFYVVNPAGSGVLSFVMPPGVVAGDSYIELFGLVGNDTPAFSGPQSGNLNVPAYIEVIGSPCGSVLGLAGGDPSGPCAGIFYEPFEGDGSSLDFALQDVPEPVSLLGFGAGLLGLTWARRRRVAA